MTLILSILAILNPAFAFSNTEQTLSLIVIPLNTPYELDIKKDTPIYIKDRILKIRLQNEKTFIVGKSVGFTTIKTLNTVTNVKILDPEQWIGYLAFKDKFKDHPNFTIHYTLNEVMVSGDILLKQDLISLLDWLIMYSFKPKFNINFASQNLREEFMSLVTERVGIPVLGLDSNLHLEVSRNLTKLDMEKINEYGFKPQSKNTNGVELGALDIQFINVSDSEIKRATPILPTSFQWTLGSKIETLSQIINSDYSKLKAINNKSSVISLMLFENERTEYHSGGEFAIQQRSIYRNDLQWKTFGLFVDVLPFSISSDEIQIELKFRISNVTSSDSNQPSLSQDSWTQKLRIKKNTSLVVSNSITNMFSRDKNDHLLLKSIPVLGALFKGRNSNKEKSNVYMVVKLTTPDAFPASNKQTVTPKL